MNLTTLSPVLKFLARLGLALTIGPAILFLLGDIDLAEVKLTMIVGTILWLGGAPIIQKQHQDG